MSIPSSDVNEFRKVLASSKNIIILSGAGLSAPSGIPTFRGSSSSLWSNPAFRKFMGKEAFNEDPSGFWQFYHHRRLIALNATPNEGHLALAVLNMPDVASRITPSAELPPLHVTQNIDELSLKSIKLLPGPASANGLERLLQMHGSMFCTQCVSCKHENHSYKPHLAASLEPLTDPLTFVDIPTDKLPRCGGDEWSGSNRYGKCGGALRPATVQFGDIPPLLGEIGRKITWCDLLIVVGTSSLVQPAAGFASQVKQHNGKVVVFNLDRSNHDDSADFLFLGSAEITLPSVFGVQDDIERYLKDKVLPVTQ